MENVENFIKSIPGLGQYFGGESLQKLLFVPNANQPEEDYEISEPALFRFLLNEETAEQCKEVQAVLPDMLNVLKDIDKHSKITEFETHQSSIDTIGDLKRAFHVFILFKTTNSETADDDQVCYWWSLEKNRDYIVLQRSRNKDDVKNQCYGETRRKVKPIVENLSGKGTINDLFAMLWANQMIPEEYHIRKSNCQSLVTFVSKRITEIGYEYKGYFGYFPPENDRNVKMLDLVKLFAIGLHPLLTLISYELIDLLDKVIQSGNYVIDAIHSGITPLHFAIAMSKTRAVQHLLQNLHADPTTRSQYGGSALQMAASFTTKTEILDLILAHDKVNVDDVDENGQTALHAAAHSSNVIAAKHFIQKGANANIFDKDGLSPLHLAARNRNGNPIIDVLLEAQKVKAMGDVDDANERGMTALHYAAFESNEITAEHLIQKGANVNYRANDGSTPLHYAALGAKDMKIIDLLLLNIKHEEIAQYKNNLVLFFGAKINKHGLEATIVARLVGKGIATEEKPENRTTHRYKVNEEVDEATGAVTRRFTREDAAADPSAIDFAQVYGFWIAGAKTLREIEEIVKERNYNFANDRDRNGETALHHTCKANNVEIARYLLDNGADPTMRDNDGLTPLHIAAAYVSDSDIFHLLLPANRNVDVDASDESGMTALHFAMATSNVTAARFLLSNGANPNTRNQNGLTPLHFATVFAKDVDIVELLVNHKGVHVNCLLDDRGLDRLVHCARFNGNGIGERIVKLLVEKRAAERDSSNGWLIGDSDPDREDVQRFYRSHRERMGKKDKKSVHHVDFFNDDKVGVEDKVERISLIRLDNAMAHSDVEKVCNLIEMGADLSKVTWGGGTNALHAASKSATKVELLRVILETERFDVNSRDDNGHTALRFAVDANSVANVGYLMGKGADATIGDNDKLTPFHVATAFHKDPEILVLLLATEKTIDIDGRSKSGLTALHMAVAESNVTAARFLLSKGANPNVADENGLTPLHLAAILAKDMDIIELLVNHKDVDVNCLDKWGRNALDYATINKNEHGETIANLLKEKGVVEAQVNNNPENIAKALALMDAITNSEVETVGNLIANGLDISAVIWGEEGMNALHLASRYAKTTDLIDVVLQTGTFDIDGVDNDGKTPLHYAIEGSDRAIIVLHLIQKGARPNIGEKRGITPIHLAAALNTDLDILDRLISHDEKVNINQSDVDGLTALHSAALASNVTAARFLLSKGANPNAALRNGVTPLHLAAKSAKDIDIVQLLLNHQDVDVNCLDNDGRSAVNFARMNEHGHGERIANLLQEKSVALEKGKIKNKSQNTVALVINAIRNSDVETIRNLIDDGYDISTATWQDGMNALHAASYYAETTDLIDVVLQTGKFHINGGEHNGRTPLHYAINGASHAIIARVQTRTDPNICYSKSGKTSVHSAAHETDTTDMDLIRQVNANTMAMVRYLMGKGADPTVRDNDGIAPLHVAATAAIATTDILESLLANGKVDVNDSSNSGLTALHMAVAECNVTAARFLLSKGANPNVAEDNGLTPLHVAANYAKDMDVIELLLNHKDVNVNYLDNRGHNALHFARNNFHGLGEAIANLLRRKMAKEEEEINYEPKNMAKALVPGRIKEDADMKTIRFLIENGQDISAMTWGGNGTNALHVAAANEKTTDLIDAILETGKFDIDGVDNDGRTPLHYAVKRPDPVTINARRLIKMGADPGIADKNGVTPLHMAARNAESMDLIEILLNTDAVDVSCVDKQGRTPLDCARDNKHRLGQMIITRLREYEGK